MPKHLSPGAPSSGPPITKAKPLRPHVDDSYKRTGKPVAPAACADCGAVFHGGRWSWLPRPARAHEIVCPACQRIRDDMPAGHVKLEGQFVAEHREEMLNLVRNVEHREKAEHPLQRIMKIGEDDGAVLITTTDVHLARGIGEALREAYQGELESQYGEDENMVRVSWKR